jgi:addiction module HigA family antidote
MMARKKYLDPIHPGEILLDDFMRPMGLSINRLARDIVVPPGRGSAIVNGKRFITVDTALRLSTYFGVSSDLWLGLRLSMTCESLNAWSAHKSKSISFATWPSPYYSRAFQLRSPMPDSSEMGETGGKSATRSSGCEILDTGYLVSCDSYPVSPVPIF